MRDCSHNSGRQKQRRRMLLASGRSLLLLAILCVLPLAGCAWEAYEQVQIGKPLPKGHLLLRKGAEAESGRAWTGYGFWPLPAIFSIDAVSAVLDESGDVVAKAYKAGASGNWLVLLSVATRTVVEVQIPAAAYHDPPLDWENPAYRPGRFDKINRLMDALEPLGKELGSGGLNYIAYGASYSPPMATEETHAEALSISPKRLAAHVRKKLQETQGEVPVQLGTDVDLTGLPRAGEILKAKPKASVLFSGELTFLKITVTAPHVPASNVVEYIDALRLPPELLGDNPPGLPALLGAILLPHAWYPLAMFHHNKEMTLTDLTEYPAALAGITEAGYDWQYTNWFGGTIRIQNLGDRRIRIESKGLTVCDITTLSLYLAFAAYAEDSDEDRFYNAVVRRRTEMIARDGESARPYVLRGATHAKKKRWRAALADYAKAVELAPDNTEIRKAYEALRAKAGREIKLEPREPAPLRALRRQRTNLPPSRINSAS